MKALGSDVQPSVRWGPSGELILQFPEDPKLSPIVKAIPAWACTWDDVSGTWTILDPYILKTLNVFWHRFPNAQVVRGPQRFERLHNAPPAADPKVAAYRVLHLLPSAPKELVIAAQRTLAKLKHPDKLGRDEEMMRINNAVDTILKEEQ